MSCDAGQNDQQKLLTIAIPTFNRSQYLDQCLAQLCKQIPAYEKEIELIISDNCSTDDTADIVSKYKMQGISILYSRNAENIGADRNVIKCYQMATSSYVLVLGDDDVLLDGSLGKILYTLTLGQYGIVYINSYGFDDDYIQEMPNNCTVSRLLIYNDLKKYIEKVNYYFTFVSGNIVNKNFIDKSINIEDFYDTSLPQTVLIFSALFNSITNVYVDDYIIAAKNNQSANYKLCKVFGSNFNKILNYFNHSNKNEDCVNVINKRLLMFFFPDIMYKIRTGKMKFQNEDSFSELKKVFKKNPYFWFLTAPVIVLPLKLAYIWLYFVKLTQRTTNVIHKITDKPQKIIINSLKIEYK